MAAYTAAQMTAGVVSTDVLTGGTAYTFTIATPAYISQSVYFGSATFMTDSSLTTNYNLSQSAIVNVYAVPPVNTSVETTPAVICAAVYAAILEFYYKYGVL
jgi:hypothetical protein